MKTKMTNLCLRNFMQQSGNELPLTKREKVMIKWFFKFQLSLILVVLSWTVPAYTAYNHYYEFNELKRQLAHKTCLAQTREETEAVKEETVARSVEEEYNYLLETDETFKNYIYNMQVARNNPGNLVYARQPNATKSGRFASFPNSRIGFRALLKQIELEQSRDHTLTTFFNRYSPPAENDTESLIQGAETTLNTKRTTKIKDVNAIALAKYITFREHSYAGSTNK